MYLIWFVNIEIQTALDDFAANEEEIIKNAYQSFAAADDVFDDDNGGKSTDKGKGKDESKKGGLIDEIKELNVNAVDEKIDDAPLSTPPNKRQRKRGSSATKSPDLSPIVSKGDLSVNELINYTRRRRRPNQFALDLIQSSGLYCVLCIIFV